VPEWVLIRNQKGCCFILTAGRWPWKQATAEECVTAHLPNESAPKMDGAKALHLCMAVTANA